MSISPVAKAKALSRQAIFVMKAQCLQYIWLELQKPILIEGAPGVGKTEMGKVLAQIMRLN
jgi:MoxR-like ATPase